MSQLKRVFILGAGFSKPAGMPLATELLPLLENKLDLDEMRSWIGQLKRTLAWLEGNEQQPEYFKLNIEQVFHYAHFDIELNRIGQHLEKVGRHDGPDTAWNAAHSIEAWLSYLERDLCEVIHDQQLQADLTSIERWAQCISEYDSIVTFNYDTLTEQALNRSKITWSHGLPLEKPRKIKVLKLHGSIDWVVSDRPQSFSKCDLLFDKINLNRSEEFTGAVEEDRRLWRCQTQDQLRSWIAGQDFRQLHEQGRMLDSVGIAGLGSYKQLHQIPGLGCVWQGALQAMHQADHVIVVGFSLSDFDAMAQMKFSDVVRRRQENGCPLQVSVIDPGIEKNEQARNRFQRVFREVKFVPNGHENINWNNFTH
jgi:SIR2-like protein